MKKTIKVKKDYFVVSFLVMTESRRNNDKMKTKVKETMTESRREKQNTNIVIAKVPDIAIIYL